MFRFKQFQVEDKDCAMKIGTDGVLLGAWANIGTNCLDIGTGSGVITLMLAQRFSNSVFTGIDIDEKTVNQAKFNFENSTWNDRIQTFEAKLQTFSTCNKFDSIVSNPPFFQDNDQIIEQNRRNARTLSSLTIQELAMHCKRLIKENGNVSIIFPFDGLGVLTQVFENEGFFPIRLCKVKGNSKVDFKRVLVEFALEKAPVIITELIIEKSRHNYTEDYIQLTKDFYLKM